MKLNTLSFLAALAACAALSAGAQTTRLDSLPTGGKVRIEGTSSIHDWQCESRIIAGFVEAPEGFPLKPGAALKPGTLPLKVNIFIPVNSLKSLEKDGKPYSTAMDNRMYEALSEPVNKRILFQATEMIVKEAPKADAPYQFEVPGNLVVAGVTNKVTLPVTATVVAENKVRFAGALTTKMTDFKVVPPALTVLGMGIKTGDEVKLSFDWTAAKKAAPAAKP